ncbi:MFS transporter [Paenibacillus turpanensis]|uniref:MFS transporter n=1 Tax=Paenibacillus turpanensis TaxID=2689078 RepID=UPI00140C6A69|nr:MFS transporter [Paenibacillus turpanensis]
MGGRSRWLLISIGLGVLLNPLNSSMVAVAIPRLQQAYHLDFTVVSWIIFSFYIASAVAQPVMGKASDIIGRKKVFITGLLVVFVASIFAPLSPNFGWLVLFRIMQSIGTSMMISVGMAIVRIHITEKQAAALSIMSSFQSGAAAIGPFIGGVLIHFWDWPAIFIVNVPFLAASLLFSWRMIPKDTPPKPVALGISIRSWMNLFDVLGIVLFSTSLIALLIGLLAAKSSGYVSISHIIFLLIGFVALGTFLRHEIKTISPFIPLRTFAKHPAIIWIIVEFLIVNVLFYTLFFGIPSYLQLVLHIGEFHTGVLMLTLGLSSLIASPMAGRWIDKLGPRPALLVSAMLMLFGSIWLVALNQSAPMIGVCVALAAFGLSNGLNSVGMQAALFNNCPKEIIGVASGLFNTSRNLGAILSSLLIGIIMGDKFSYGGLQLLGIILTITALSLVLMFLRRKEQKQIELDHL